MLDLRPKTPCRSNCLPVSQMRLVESQMSVSCPEADWLIFINSLQLEARP